MSDAAFPTQPFTDANPDGLQPAIDELIQQGKQMIGKVKVREARSAVFTAISSQLDKFTRDELRAYAESVGVPRGQSKRDTIKNLIQAGKATVCATLGN